jgi:hypothetical protein
MDLCMDLCVEVGTWARKERARQDTGRNATSNKALEANPPSPRRRDAVRSAAGRETRTDWERPVRGQVPRMPQRRERVSTATNGSSDVRRRCSGARGVGMRGSRGRFSFAVPVAASGVFCSCWQPLGRWRSDGLGRQVNCASSLFRARLAVCGGTTAGAGGDGAGHGSGTSLCNSSATSRMSVCSRTASDVKRVDVAARGSVNSLTHGAVNCQGRPRTQGSGAPGWTGARVRV